MNQILNTGREVFRHFHTERITEVDREKVTEHIENGLSSFPFGESEDNMNVRQVLTIMLDEGVIFEIVNFGEKVGER